MAYGYAEYDAAGNLIFDSNDATWSILGTFTALGSAATTYFEFKNVAQVRVSRMPITEINGDIQAFTHTWSIAYNYTGSTHRLTAASPNIEETTDTVFIVFGR
jgi:hypothetical protein